MLFAVDSDVTQVLSLWLLKATTLFLGYLVFMLTRRVSRAEARVHALEDHLGIEIMMDGSGAVTDMRERYE